MTKEGLGRQPRLRSVGAQIGREYSQACTDFTPPVRRGVSLCVGCCVCVYVRAWEGRRREESIFLFFFLGIKKGERGKKTQRQPHGSVSNTTWR